MKNYIKSLKLNIGAIGYLLIAISILLSFWNKKLFSLLFVIGGFLVSYNWIKFGKKNKDKIMKTNGYLFFITPLITILVAIFAILIQSISLIKYYLITVFVFGFIGFGINVCSHYRAFKKTKINYFKISALIRTLCFSLVIGSSIPFIKEILSLSSFLQLSNLLNNKSTEIFLVSSLIYVIACFLSAKSFSEIN